jgi:hypothetical protein
VRLKDIIQRNLVIAVPTSVWLTCRIFSSIKILHKILWKKYDKNGTI